MTRAEIASAVEQIVAVVVHEHGLMEASEGSRSAAVWMTTVAFGVLFRAKERFGLVLPDIDIGPSSTVGDIVDLIAEREKEAQLARAQAIKAAWENASKQG